MSPRASDDFERGFGRSQPSEEVAPEEDDTAPEESPTESVEIPLGMPFGLDTLADLKRRAAEPDPEPAEEGDERGRSRGGPSPLAGDPSNGS